MLLVVGNELAWHAVVNGDFDDTGVPFVDSANKFCEPGIDFFLGEEAPNFGFFLLNVFAKNGVDGAFHFLNSLLRLHLHLLVVDGLVDAVRLRSEGLLEGEFIRLPLPSLLTLVLQDHLSD